MKKFSLQTLLAVVAMVVLSCGWFLTWHQVDGDRKKVEKQLRVAEEELRAKVRHSDLARAKKSDFGRPFREADFAGSSLTETTIVGKDSAFQLASFRNSKLNDAILTGEVASFQAACFDGANLTRTKLSGGDCSFQESTFAKASLAGATLNGGFAAFQVASFVQADLTGATLTGGPNSFQQASFEDAMMVGVKLMGNFQCATMSGAKLQGADLSSLDGDTLVSWKFDRSPIYDAKTKFPVGFDPLELRWQRLQ